MSGVGPISDAMEALQGLSYQIPLGLALRSTVPRPSKVVNVTGRNLKLPYATDIKC
jgi:hypothetical protein